MKVSYHIHWGNGRVSCFNVSKKQAESIAKQYQNVTKIERVEYK